MRRVHIVHTATKSHYNGNKGTCIKAAQKEWNAIRQKFIQTLISSVDIRIQTVIPDR